MNVDIRALATGPEIRTNRYFKTSPCRKHILHAYSPDTPMTCWYNITGLRHNQLWYSYSCACGYMPCSRTSCVTWKKDRRMGRQTVCTRRTYRVVLHPWLGVCQLPHSNRADARLVAADEAIKVVQAQELLSTGSCVVIQTAGSARCNLQQHDGRHQCAFNAATNGNICRPQRYGRGGNLECKPETAQERKVCY